MKQKKYKNFKFESEDEVEKKIKQITLKDLCPFEKIKIGRLI